MLVNACPASFVSRSESCKVIVCLQRIEQNTGWAGVGLRLQLLCTAVCAVVWHTMVLSKLSFTGAATGLLWVWSAVCRFVMVAQGPGAR
jgi:hypothetical protein